MTLPSPASITRITIWLALLAYFFVAGSRALAGQAAGKGDWLRRIWTFGCVAYVAHVASAFQFYHQWSHSAALEHTARVTGAMTGWHSGFGLWVNYLFTALWVADVIWWWKNPASHESQSKVASAAWQGFMFFIVFNATVVFGHGPVRWFGLVGCVILVCLFVVSRVRSRPRVSSCA